MSNPFTLTFGKLPTEYIVRHENIGEIKDAFNDNPARCQTYLIRGVRGSGKTVLMTAIAKELCEDNQWVGVDLNSTTNLIDEFANRLMDACKNKGNILDRGYDFSIAGFGLGIGSREDRDSVSKCESLLEILKKKKKKVLITIDEVNNDISMKQFASQFQIWIRKDYPIYLIMTGLYEHIDAIQNNPQLTFLLRSPKISLEPLGISQITRQYKNILCVSSDEALTLAKITKGYAFAFQALGMLVWEEDNQCSLDAVMEKLDDLLDEYVYRRVWNDLSERDREIVINMPYSGSIKTSEICEKVGMTTQVFSKYRERLINKGIIQSNGHGYVEFALPRFGEVCRLYA